MSTGTLIRETFELCDQVPDGPAAADELSIDPWEPLAERWHHADPFRAVLDELAAMGHAREAAVLEGMVVHTTGDQDDQEDGAIRAYVSALWAEDWDSEEDSVYDNF